MFGRDCATNALQGEKSNIIFNVKVLKDGIRRMVNDFPDTLRSPRALR